MRMSSTHRLEVLDADVDAGAQARSDVGRTGGEEAEVLVPHEFVFLPLHVVAHLAAATRHAVNTRCDIMQPTCLAAILQDLFGRHLTRPVWPPSYYRAHIELGTTFCSRPVWPPSYKTCLAAILQDLSGRHLTTECS